MFLMYDSAYDMRNPMNTIMLQFNSVKCGKMISLILVQSYGISLIMKPNKLLI